MQVDGYERELRRAAKENGLTPERVRQIWDRWSDEDARYDPLIVDRPSQRPGIRCRPVAGGTAP